MSSHIYAAGAVLEPKRLNDRQIAELVDRGGKLHKELKPFERKRVELEDIKNQLRELAEGKDTTFTGKEHTAIIEQKPPTICRVVAEEDLEWTLKTAGPRLSELFTLHPSKGKEKNFELNAMKVLAKKFAVAMVARFTGPATPWVRFS